MTEDKDKKLEYEEACRKTPKRDNVDHGTFDTAVMDTLKPPSRIPDNKDKSDERKK